MKSSSSRTTRGAVAALATAGMLAGALAGSTATAAPAPAERAPARDTLFPTQGNNGYDVRRYLVDLDYTPETNHLDAVTTIKARARHELTRFHLDLEGLSVGSVRVDGQKAAFRRYGHELVVTPRKPVAGVFTTVVAYSGTPSEHKDTDGSTEGWVRTADGATALGEPVGTATWIPSNNTPGDKARYRYRVRVPAGTTVAANGVLTSKVRQGTHTTWTWDAPDRMSTYLATVAIGSFHTYRSSTRSITGRRIPIWSFTDTSSEAAESTAPARKLLPQVLRFEEKRFGPYPLASAGIIVDNADVGYALETQTRPFYPFSLDTDTLVHESAHQWYGDSVTLRDWHDIWLAEGFATYAEWLWDAHHGGDTPAERFATLYAKPASDDLWHPAPTEFTKSADLFGSPVYNRGAMTLQVLRARVGSEDFFHIIKAWARIHRQGSARTPQLVALSERISGKQLDGLFATWLQKDGKPRGY